MVIYLDQYRRANATTVIAARCHHQKKLCGNASPTTGVIVMFSNRKANDLSPELPENLTQVDIEASFGRIYALAGQI